MTLRERLNRIIDEQHISKTEFACRLGVTRNYVYILTGAEPKRTRLSPSLAKLIAAEFGYNEEWVRTGSGSERRSNWF